MRLKALFVFRQAFARAASHAAAKHQHYQTMPDRTMENRAIRKHTDGANPCVPARYDTAGFVQQDAGQLPTTSREQVFSGTARL